MRLNTQRRRNKRAILLFLTLWIVLVLSLLACSLAFQMRVEVKLTSTHRKQFQAEQLARIGVARAVMNIRNDSLIEMGLNESDNKAFDALGDVWAMTLEPVSYPVEKFGFYDLIVIDEESKLDLNAPNPEWIKVMQNLLVTLEVDDEEALQLAQAIWDWKDPDNIAASTAGLLETDFYTELTSQISGAKLGDVAPVYPKNDNYSNIDELLQVPGMTPQIFYGYDPQEETDPPFFPTRSTNERREQIPGLKDLVTVRAKNLNLNTVGYEVLSALCGAVTEDPDSGKQMARKIIDYRQGRKTKDIDNNKAFRSLNDLSALQEASLPSLIASIGKVVPLTTISNFFTIYCQAQTGEKTKKTWTSSKSNKETPAPRARVVAQCQRDLLVYDLEAFDKRDHPPGYQGEDYRLKKIGVGGTLPIQWLIPVVRFIRWISY